MPSTPSQGLRSLAAVHRDEIVAIARRCRIAAVEIFGSAARGEDHEGSDLDLLITPDDDATLFDITAFRRAVVDLLGVDVDVVSRRALLPTDQDVLDDAIAL